MPGSRHVKLHPRGTQARAFSCLGCRNLNLSRDLLCSQLGAQFQWVPPCWDIPTLWKGKRPRGSPPGACPAPCPKQKFPFLCFSVPGPGSSALPALCAPRGGAEAPSWKSGWRPHFPGRAGSCCVPGGGREAEFTCRNLSASAWMEDPAGAKDSAKLGKAPGPAKLP